MRRIRLTRLSVYIRLFQLKDYSANVHPVQTAPVTLSKITGERT